MASTSDNAPTVTVTADNLYAWTTTSTSDTNMPTVYTKTETPTTNTPIYNASGERIDGTYGAYQWHLFNASGGAFGVVYLISASSSSISAQAADPISATIKEI